MSTTYGTNQLKTNQVEGLDSIIDKNEQCFMSIANSIKGLNDTNDKQFDIMGSIFGQIDDILRAEHKHKMWLFKHLNFILLMAFTGNVMALIGIAFTLYTIITNHLK